LLLILLLREVLFPGGEEKWGDLRRVSTPLPRPPSSCSGTYPRLQPPIYVAPVRFPLQILGVFRRGERERA
jgi:hypothetical protein